MNIDQITPYSKNSKIHDKKQIALLAKVIKEVGWRQNVEVNQQGVIVAGHGRWLVWQEHKKDLPPIWIVDDKGNTIHGEHATDPLTAEQEKMWRIADNQINAMTGFDMKLAIEDMKDLSIEMAELTGLDMDLLIEPDENDDVIPEDVPAVAKLGDLWALGRHRLLCGDATKIEDVERLMDGKKADMVFTDPPYGVSWQNNAVKRFDKLMNDDVILEIAPIIDTVVKDDSAVYIWTAQSVYPIWRNQFKETYKSTIIWNKGGGGKGDLKGDFMPTYEMCMFCPKGRPRFRNIRPSAVWDIKKDSMSDYKHATQKPIQLAVNAMDIHSDREDVIVDLFLGSGSTLIASEKTGRNCYGMELDPKYCDVIIKRWEDYTNQKAVKL